MIKRRGFLALLGLLPAVPALVKEALFAPEPIQKAMPVFKAELSLSWHGKNLKADGKWHRYDVRRSDGVEKLYVDGELTGVHVEPMPIRFTDSSREAYTRDVMLTFQQHDQLNVGSGPVRWPETFNWLG